VSKYILVCIFALFDGYNWPIDFVITFLARTCL